jgi:hypothetical protein
MRDYWTCSKFADWLRGSPKLKVGTSKEWRLWKEASKEKHPFRYWLAEEGLDKLQDIWMWIPDRINDVRYYINNRWVNRTHALTAHARDIRPGSWCDVGNRFLPCLFNELVDFVEVEQAWHHVLWDEEARKKYAMPWWQKNWYTRWGREWRCPEAGVDHLKWASSLVFDEDMCVDPGDESYGKPTLQAQNAMEILALYTWWKEVYPNRPDIYDVSGWSAYCELRRQRGRDFLDLEDKTEEEAEMGRVALDKTREIEAAYEKEDEEMMIRLIKVRHSLWT